MLARALTNKGMMNTPIRIATILILITVSVLGFDGIWEEQSNMPEPRTGHAAAVINDVIYVSGGRSSHSGMHSAQAQLWAYDTQTGAWDTGLPEMNEPREDHVMVALGDTLWVFGGHSHNDLIGEVSYWVVGADQWISVSQMAVPRLGMGAYVQNGNIYLIGGKTSPAFWSLPVSRVDCFNPFSQAWTIRDSLTQARVDFAVAASSDTILCIGGRFVDPLASVERSTETGDWTYGIPLAVPRANSAAVVFQNQPILLGGITTGGQAESNLLYDGVSWADFPLNLLPRYDLTALATPTGVFILGGRNGNQVLNSVERFSPTVAIREDPVRPGTTALLRAYPNPFNGSVVLELNLVDINPKGGQLTIYNTQGRQVCRRTVFQDAVNSSFVIPASELGTSGLYLAVFEYFTTAGYQKQLTAKLISLK